VKIKVWSDLHLEFRDYLFDHIHLPRETDKDTILLLSGDISVGTTAIPFVTEMCKHFKHVLMVAGNHEFYYNDVVKVNDAWADWEAAEGPTNFHYLYNDWRMIDGVRFLGGTMWTSFNNADPMVMLGATQRMADYLHIEYAGGKLTPTLVLAEHLKFMGFLRAELDKQFDGKTVVLTHHSPGTIIKRKNRAVQSTDYCYFAELEHMIGMADKVALWTHGHTHQSYNYLINNTRVICNPYGYWGEAVNTHFDRELIIEI
jgi:hypothetical protein